MKTRKWVLIGAVPVFLIVAVIALAAGTAAGGSDSTPPPPESRPSPPPNIPEPRSTQDGLSSEERNEIKARRGTPSWGSHTAGTVIEIAGRQVQLPTDVYVEGIVDHVLCVEGESCPNTPIYGLRRGDSRVGIGSTPGSSFLGRPTPTWQRSTSFRKRCDEHQTEGHSRGPVHIDANCSVRWCRCRPP